MGSAPESPMWRGTDAYEAYMGRWSRPMARAFVDWFATPKGARWLDVGCGTGALTEAVLAGADPIGKGQCAQSDARGRLELISRN